MRLHGLVRVKNEGDIIEEFVRHNLRYLDALTIADNASFDGTVTVLEALAAEGLPVTIVHDPILPKRQYETMTRLARQSAADSDWDFLFLLDADEFVKARDRNALEDALAVLSPGQNGLLPWVTYVPTRHDPADEPRILERIRYRRIAEPASGYSKCVLSRGFAQAGTFRIPQGNHAAYDERGKAPAVELAGAALAHFPVRSLTQIQGKVLLGWGAYLAMGYDTVGVGWHQRRLFQKLESDPAWTANDLYETAIGYSDKGPAPDPSRVTYDPLAPVPVWRYGDNAIPGPMQLAAGYVRQLAGALANGAETVSPQSPAPNDS